MYINVIPRMHTTSSDLIRIKGAGHRDKCKPGMNGKKGRPKHRMKGRNVLRATTRNIVWVLKVVVNQTTKSRRF